MESVNVSLNIKDIPLRPIELRPKKVYKEMESGLKQITYMPLEWDSVPEALRLKANKELNENEEVRHNGLKRLKEIIKREKIPCWKNDDFILSFLRSKKFNINRAESKLKQFSHTGKVLVEVLHQLDINKIRKILDSRCFGLLPYRDEMGRAILYTRGKGLKFKLYNIDDAAKCVLLLLIYASALPMSSTCGIQYIGCAKMNSNYDLFAVVKVFKDWRHHILNLPYHLKRVDLINCNSLARCLIEVVRPLLPKKISERVSVHGSNLDGLYQGYDPSILPPDFGGTLERWEVDWYKEPFLEFVQRLRIEMQPYSKEFSVIEPKLHTRAKSLWSLNI